jgi:hypothetical protein
LGLHRGHVWVLKGIQLLISDLCGLKIQPLRLLRAKLEFPTIGQYFVLQIKDSVLDVFA